MVNAKDLLNTEIDLENFDLTEVQEIISEMREMEVIDLAHADLKQQMCLFLADKLNDHCAVLTKQISKLESNLSVEKNKASLDYKAEEGKTTTDMKVWAGNCAPKVIEIQNSLASLKGVLFLLSKKSDLVLKSFYYFKALSDSYRRTTALGFNPVIADSNDNWVEQKQKK